MPPTGAQVAGTDFRNVKIFDGQGDRLSASSNVRVKGNRIERIPTEPLPAELGATVIEGGGQEELGAALVADSPDEVRMRTREQLFQGTAQIKLTAGGGVS